MLIGSLIQIFPFDFKPSAPPAGSFIFYAKTDDTLYIQDSAGTEFAFGSTGFISELIGDVSAMGPGTATATVNFVGGSSAANVHSAELLANAATALNTPLAIVKRDSSGNFAAGIITAALNGNAATATTAISFSGSLVGDVTGTQSATVVSFVGGASASDIAAATATVDAATNLNTSSTLVKRDASGNFSAGVITADLVGNVTGNVSGSAASFTGNLLGDVTGTQGATVVSFVGGSSAANVHSAELAANAATAINTALTIVKRDASGNFSATNITANITGNVSGSAASFTGNLLGDVTGTQSATTIADSVVTGKLLTGYAVGSNVALSATDTILQAFEKIQAQINATTGAAITALTGDVSATGPGSVAATVNSVGGSSAANIHSAELAANAATALDTASTIVKRDGSGGFAAGAIAISSFIVTGVSDIVQGVVQGFTTQTSDIFQVLKFDNTVLFKVNNSGNGILSGTIAASNFSGSSSGTNTGDVTTTNTNSINLAFVSGQTGLSATLNLSSDAADAGNVKATTTVHANGLHVELPFGTPSNVGTTNNPGSSSSISLADHVHAISASVVLGLTLTGYVTGSNTPITSSNTLLVAFENLQAQISATVGAAITALTGDVSATGPGSVAATVNSVGGSSAANIHSAELAANAATALNTASAIVKRDASGNFAASRGDFTSLGVNDTSATSTVYFKTSAIGTPTFTIKQIASQTADLMQILDSSGATQMVFTSGGNFKFFHNASIPEARFDLRPSVNVLTINTGANARYSMFVGDSATVQAAGQGGGIAFGAAQDNIGTATEMGLIWVTKNNSTAGNISSNMHFATRNNTSGNAQRVLDMDESGNSTFWGNIAQAGSTSGVFTQAVPATITNYTLTWPSAVGTAGSYLSIDASGNGSWTNPLVNIDGGNANSNYTASQIINGGTA